MDAHLEWSIKLSLLMYTVNSPGGALRTDGVTSDRGRFRFPIDPDHSGPDEYAFTGSVALFAHYGMPITTLTALRVHRDANGEWMLEVTPEASAIDAFRLGMPTTEPGALVFTDVRLTAAGAEMFSGSYQAGEMFDPIRVQLAAAGS